LGIFCFCRAIRIVKLDKSAREVKLVLEPEDREFAQLVDWVEGRLTEDEARTVEKQVAADGDMQANVTWLRAFALISEDTVIVSPPPEVRDTLVEHFQEYAERKRRSGLLKRFVAKLSFDSGLQPALGLRTSGGIPEQPREFVYCSEVADIAISVRLRPHDGLLDVDGQIFPVDDPDPGAFSAQLLDDSSEAATTTTNDLGEFSFGAVLPGTYDVLASSDQVEIWLPGVEVRRGR
jgi:hypothetical protein